MEDPETRRLARDVAVGWRIAERRVERRMSQAQLAEGLVDASFISFVEGGKRRPHIELLEDLAVRLDTTLAWLADGTPNASAADLTVTELAGARALLAAADHFETQFTAGVHETRTWDVVQELRRQAATSLHPKATEAQSVSRADDAPCNGVPST